MNENALIQWNTGMGEIMLGKYKGGRVYRADGCPCSPPEKPIEAETVFVDEFIKSGKWIFAAK